VKQSDGESLYYAEDGMAGFTAFKYFKAKKQ